MQGEGKECSFNDCSAIRFARFFFCKFHFYIAGRVRPESEWSHLNFVILLSRFQIRNFI